VRVSARLLKHGGDVLALEIAQAPALRAALHRHAPLNLQCRDRLVNVGQGELPLTGTERGPLYAALQLANIAIPRIGAKQADVLQTERRPSDQREEVIQQKRDVTHTVRQRRHIQRDAGDAIVEVGPPAPRLDQQPRGLLRAEHEPKPNLPVPRTPHHPDTTGLEHSEQLGLKH
jgi:hypothetical protein